MSFSVQNTENIEDVGNAFGSYLGINTFFGVWPLVQIDLHLKLRLIVTGIELVTMVAFVFYEMIQYCGNAEDFLDSLLIIAAGVISLSKFILCQIYRDILKIHVVLTIQDWSTPEAMEYSKVMASYKKMYKIFTYLYGTVIFVGASLHCVARVLLSPTEVTGVTSMDDLTGNVTEFVSKRRYTFPSTCTLSDVSDRLYVFHAINQLVQTLMCVTVLVGSDAIFFAITGHLCGQFEILKLRFMNVGNESSLLETSTIREQVNALISKHQQLLRRMELVEEAYNKIILVQLMTSISVTSAAGFGFVISLKSKDLFSIVKTFIEMQSLLLQSFMYTSIGEALQNASDNIMNSAYNGSWYELPRYLSMDFLFIMMRSGVPTQLTAGKFFLMTRATFMKIVKITFSYISALQLMLNE